ncbi:MAG: hypothetical protein O3A29_12700 [Planctomycetota bacterium]|nr:hypothetical protein [Planctomycetota bacterium]
MYRCEMCGVLVPPRTAVNRLVIETREKVYPYRSKANRVAYLDEKGKHKVAFIDDPGGTGLEIVKEINVCPTCATSALG